MGTTLLQSKYIKRYANWINYYGLSFPKYDLILGNDGGEENSPIAEEVLKLVDDLVKPRVKFYYHGPFLGRLNHCIFPGWRRSFREILNRSDKDGYDKIIFIETDLYIRKKYVNKYTELFDEDIYCAGFSEQHAMMETSLQILNDKKIRKEIIDFFNNSEELMSNICAEPQMQARFNPILNKTKGTRLEGNVENINDWEFYAQCDYDTYKKYIEEL
jgi:hypothetical protein